MVSSMVIFLALKTCLCHIITWQCQLYEIFHIKIENIQKDNDVYKWFSGGRRPVSQVQPVLYQTNRASQPGAFKDALSLDPELPPSLEGLEEKEESFITMADDYEEFKRYLQENYWLFSATKTRRHEAWKVS